MDGLLSAIHDAWGLRLPPETALLRLTAALALGAVIGADREWRRRPAGLRTHMLVSLASAMFTILAFHIYGEVQNADENDTADPLRLLEAITAGVAFLAAGTIIRRDEKVVGLTTGGGLWFSGAVGMACGTGLLLLAALGATLAVAVLAVLGAVERRWM